MPVLLSQFIPPAPSPSGSISPSATSVSLLLLCKQVQQYPKTLGIKLPYDPAISLLGRYPKKTITEKDTCTPVFIEALLTIART